LLGAAQSLLWVLADRRRYQEMQRGIDVPVLLLHGDRDRLVPIAAAREAARANPTWRFRVAEGVGHVPQLEVPDWTADQILAWLTEHPESAGAAAAAATVQRHVRDATRPLSSLDASFLQLENDAADASVRCSFCRGAAPSYADFMPRLPTRCRAEVSPARSTHAHRPGGDLGR
jgi:hypothetical protein